MLQFPTEWKCLACGNTRPRFIKPDTSMPLFLAVKTKTPEDKKFLEEIMQEPVQPVQPKRSFFFSEMDNQHVFVRTEGQKFLDVYKIEKWCEILAKEIREREESA